MRYSHQTHCPNAPLPTWHAPCPTASAHTHHVQEGALTGNVDDIEAPLDDPGPAEVLASGDERARRRVAPRGADALEVAREEDRGPEREDVDPERELRRRERAAAEEQAEEDRERARDE